ncbi:hypothetical protein LPYR103PRE_24760 [Segatella asaccharophila]
MTKRTWGKVIRSTKFEHICFPEGYWFEDTLFCFILYSMCTKMVTIPDDVYLYRINPKGISSTSVGNPKVIDSLLVTLQLLEDSKTLGLSMTAQFYDMYLRQVRMNYSRIITLHDPTIAPHVFAATCRAKRQYFLTEHTTNSHLIPIELALDEHDFGKYRVQCSIR